MAAGEYSSLILDKLTEIFRKIFFDRDGNCLKVIIFKIVDKRPRRKQRGIATLFLTFHAPQGAGNLPVILLKQVKYLLLISQY